MQASHAQEPRARSVRASLRTAVLALSVLLLLTPPVARAQAAPFCAPGESPGFADGFAELRRQVGPAMGDAIECAHPNDDGNGDVLQHTTTGLSFWRKSTNTPTFTDGYHHWGLTPTGLVTWIGSSIDPPGVVAAPAPPAPRPSVVPPVPAVSAPPAPSVRPAPAPAAPPPPPARPSQPTAPPAPPPPGPSSAACHSSYPDFCIPAASPDLNCDSPALQGRRRFTVRSPDPHRFDQDRDGIGCE